MNIQLNTSCAALNLRYIQPQRQTMPSPSASSANSVSVSISQAARDRLAEESGKGSDSVLAKLLSESAHEDPDKAEELAYERAHSPYAPWLDFSEHVNGTGPIRYAATGEPVTEESEAYFNSVASAELQKRIDLYDAEKAKGTPAADILDKIFEYMDTLPARYREMMRWTGPAAG